MFTVVIHYSSGRAVVIGGDYANAEHARRDCVLQRIARPRAHRVAAYGPGGLLLGLNRRTPKAAS
jgi:hypothetical protein